MAMMALAEHIDRLTMEIKQLRDEPGFDSWSGWLQGEPVPESHPVEGAVDRAPAPDQEAEVLAAVAALSEQYPPKLEVSFEDAKAWIEKNYGAPVDDTTAAGRQAILQAKLDMENAPNVESVDDFFRTDGNGVVESRIDWSPLSQKHHDARYEFAKRVLQLDVALGPLPDGEDGDWFEDYAKVGPMWMYIPNRDLVIQYPENVRAQMVADLELYDKRVAYEFAYDVLKKPMSTDRTGGAPQPVGYAEHQLG